jgi:hypothetical protein
MDVSRVDLMNCLLSNVNPHLPVGPIIVDLIPVDQVNARSLATHHYVRTFELIGPFDKIERFNGTRSMRSTPV